MHIDKPTATLAKLFRKDRQELIMKYSIYAALREDVNSGWVWVDTPVFKQRAVICISDTAIRKKVYCEILRIDKNFLNYYNKSREGLCPFTNFGIIKRFEIKSDIPTLVINQWYRRKLLGDDGSTQSKHELQITEVDNWYGKIRACLQHPQVIVRIATTLGIISVVEGLIGLVLAIASLCN
jgi:hypothetical protein